MTTAPVLPVRLNSRLVLAGAGLLAAALLLAALSLLVYQRGEFQAAALDRSELYARVLEDEANRTLNSVEVVLEAAAESLLLRRGGSDPTAVALLLQQQSLQALPFLRSISLVDVQGRVLASSNPANLGRQIARQQLLADNRMAGMGPLLPGRDLADLVRPAASANGRPTQAAPKPGASLLPLVRRLDSGPQSDWLVAAINPDYFANQYELLLGESPQQAALLTLDGQLVAASAGIRLATGVKMPGHRVFSQFLPAKEHGAFIGPGLDGQASYIAFRMARRQPLLVLVETPEAAVSAQLQAMALKVASGTAALLLLVGVLGSLAWRSLRGRELAQDALATAWGSMAAQDAFTDRLFQVSPVSMVVKDSDGRFLRVNKAWSDLTGLASERVIGLNLGRLYPLQLAAPHEVQEQMAMASGQPVNYEEQILDADGLPRDVMIRVMPYTDAAGVVAGVISCLTDVSEFREAAQRTLEGREAAERANAAKSEFVANISHELRTPLQSILGFSELGRLRSRTDVRLREMFDDIHSAGQRMLALVNNLLDLSWLASPVGEIGLVTVDIKPGLRAVARELLPMAEARDLRLSLPVEDSIGGGSPLWALADDVRLQQVLRNVLANAIRFAPAGSEIELSWQQDEAGDLRVQVRDHGPGIPADELETIFESFVQSSRTKDGSGGTGLGLAICRRIMAAHHGQISARNHPAGGAVFEFSLPALAPGPAAAGVSAPLRSADTNAPTAL
jgi:PAS domain S-box-containing protein